MKYRFYSFTFFLFIIFLFEIFFVRYIPVLFDKNYLSRVELLGPSIMNIPKIPFPTERRKTAPEIRKFAYTFLRNNSDSFIFFDVVNLVFSSFNIP